MKIKKAIITAAGFGTRFFPVSKSIQKEMLPLLNKPIIDYVVDDCLRAGIEEIIFVVNDTNDQIRHYYSEDMKIYNHLKFLNKLKKYEKIERLHTKAKFSYIIQQAEGIYGTAVPVMLSYDHVKDEEAFLVLTGDDFFLNTDGSSDISNMISEFEKNNADGMVTCMSVPHEEVSKYGIAEYKEVDGVKYLTNQIEKPLPHEVTSNYIVVSKSIFKPSIFKYFKGQKPDPRTNEMYLTTAYSAMAKKEKVMIYEPKGKYIDSGDVFLWLKSNLLLAKEDKVIWDKLLNLFKTLE